MAMIMPRALAGTAVVKFALGAFTALVLAGCSDSIERFSSNYNNPSDQDPVYTASVPRTYKQKSTIKHWSPPAVNDSNDQVTENPITPPYQPKVAANNYANSYQQAYQAPAVAAPSYQPPAVTQPSVQPPKLAYNAVKTPVAPVDPAYDNVPAAPQVAATPKLKVLDDSATADAPAQVADAGATKVTMKPGMTLYGLARSHHLTVQQLAAANNIKPPYIVPPGRVLNIPSSAAAAQAAASADDAQVASPTVATAAKLKPKLVLKSTKTEDQIAQSDTGDQITDGDAKTSATPMLKKPAPLTMPKQQDATIATSETPVDGNPQLALRWPLHGKIISGFGPKQNGLKNEGINIAVPEGTNIQAAEAGVVAYAGNELKGYGNLVLIRHEGGYVTAYAHASKLLVKKGDVVKRGSVIAVAGQTGAVQSPQLHFEVRKGATALDPEKFLGSSTALN